MAGAKTAAKSKGAEKAARGEEMMKRADNTPIAPKGKLSEAADKAIKALEKSGMLGNINKPIDFVPTGNWVVDRIIGDGKGNGGPGGFPRGFMTEVSGKESSGKSTLCLQAIPGLQRSGEMTIYMDFEKSLRAQQHYIRNMGIDASDRSTFLHVEPDTLEEGVEVMTTLLTTMRPAYMVCDSVAAMIPAQFLSGKLDESLKVGLHARLVSVMVGVMNKLLQKTNTALVFVNQIRAKIGVAMPGAATTDTTGGFAFKFYMHLRLQLTPTTKISSDKTSEITGETTKVTSDQKVKVVAIKNKMDRAFRTEVVYLRFGEGFDGIRSLVDMAQKRGILTSGSWVTYVSANNPEFNFKVNGKDPAIAHLKQHPEIIEDMKERCFPEVSIMEAVAAKANGELEEDSLDDEMKKLLAEMNAGMAAANAPSPSSDEMEIPEED